MSRCMKIGFGVAAIGLCMVFGGLFAESLWPEHLWRLIALEMIGAVVMLGGVFFAGTFGND